MASVHSRRAAVFLSLFMMAFSTFSMGCLPTYASVGVLAPMLLVFVRLLQGLSVGGQLVGTYVTAHILHMWPRHATRVSCCPHTTHAFPCQPLLPGT